MRVIQSIHDCGSLLELYMYKTKLERRELTKRLSTH